MRSFILFVWATSLCGAQGLPSWLTIYAQQRTRYETEDVRYRPKEVGGDQQLPLRQRLRGSVSYKKFFSTVEVQDSRVELTDSGSTITPTQENFTHLLQAYVGFRSDSFLSRKFQTSIEAGRFSRAIGSGRLLAAEEFRNTSSAYDGAILTFGTQRWTAVSYYFHPVLYTYPDIKVNPLLRDARLGGVNYTYRLNKTTSLEAYVLHNHDGASTPFATRRTYLTEGGRAIGQNARWGYQVEAAYQHGHLGPRQQRAWFTHAEAGYTMQLPWRPRISPQYDYASGTHDPTSNVSNAFDPLYGIRRNDLGPTGIWGLQSRSNLNSPSARLQLTPWKNGEIMVHHHWTYLAQARDQWRGVGLVDPTGKAGRTVGQMTEFRLRHRWSKYFDSEASYVYFREGRFVRELRPNSRGWAGYFYASTDLHF